MLLLSLLRDLHPDSFRIRERGMTLLTGRHEITEALKGREPFERILSLSQERMEGFLRLREKYLLYRQM